MAYNMYNNSSSKRGFFYDVRNLPYGYYGMHPMDQAVVEYQRGRPAAKLPARQLNRHFKPTTIQIGSCGGAVDEDKQQQVVTISVVQQQQAKHKTQQVLVLTSGSGEDSDAIAASTVTLPELHAVKLVQRLRKLIKWKPNSSGQMPTFGQGLVHEDTVFKALIVPLPSQPQQHGIKILAESRSRDPQERRELSSVLLPFEPACLTKFRAALAELVSTESPLYHTESLQVSDGSKFYLDLIREEAAHYLKVSHVTRDFRSIVIVPASDVAALRDLLDSSLRAMQDVPPTKDSGKQQQQQPRKGGRKPRWRTRFPQRKRRLGGGSEEEAEKENENSSSNSSSAAATADAVEKPPQQQQQSVAEDDSTVESRPVENGDQTASVNAE